MIGLEVKIVRRLTTLLLSALSIYGLGFLSFAQSPLPNARDLLRQVRDQRGTWRTVQYVQEIPYGPRTVVAIENPAKMRIEIRQGPAFGENKLTVVSDGEYTWFYNSGTKQYSRLPGGVSPVALLLNLEALTARNTDLVSDLTPVLDLLVRDLREESRTIRSEFVKVDGQSRACWMISSDARSVGTLLTYIDRELLVPFKIEKTSSLKVDEPIPAGTFAWTPPKGYRQVSSPLSEPSVDEIASRLNLGDWRSLQFSLKLDSSLTFDLSRFPLPPNPPLIIPSKTYGEVMTANVAIYKPNKMRVDIKQSRAMVTFVSDGTSSWIADSDTRQYARLSAPPDPYALMNVLGTVMAKEANAEVRLLDSAGAWRSQLALMFSLRETPISIRSETIELDGRKRDCWVITSSIDLERADSKTTWVDKILLLPLRIQWGTIPYYRVLEEVHSLKADSEISPETFLFAPPQGYREVGK